MKINFIWDDKTWHVYAGILISVLTGFATYYFTTVMPIIGCLVGFGCGVAAGLAKEFIWDKAMKKGTFSWHDAIATFWGSLVGAVVLRILIDVLEK